MRLVLEKRAEQSVRVRCGGFWHVVKVGDAILATPGVGPIPGGTGGEGGGRLVSPSLPSPRPNLSIMLA